MTTNLDTETALTVIRQLNAFDGSARDVPDEELAAGVCLNQACSAFLERHGGASARWNLVGLLCTTLDLFVRSEDAAAPLAVAAHAKLAASKGGLAANEASALREVCEKTRDLRVANTFWAVAAFAVAIADQDADALELNFSGTLARMCVNLGRWEPFGAVFPELMDALEGTDLDTASNDVGQSGEHRVSDPMPLDQFLSAAPQSPAVEAVLRNWKGDAPNIFQWVWFAAGASEAFRASAK